MSRRKRNGKHAQRGRKSRFGTEPRKRYQRACQLAVAGSHEDALQILYALERTDLSNSRLTALVHNDVGVLHTVAGDLHKAAESFAEALAADSQCLQARANLALLNAEFPSADREGFAGSNNETIDETPSKRTAGDSTCRIAILSFLFNWPSTGGGIVHTVELAQFLAQAGYEVRHFHARNLSWGVGTVEKPLPFASQALEFSDLSWTVEKIQQAFRSAVDAFDPDMVIISDAWNMKPVLAEAVNGYRYLLRQQALECICPLNNLRLLVDDGGRVSQCPKNQFASPADCRQCLAQRGQASGRLHQAERALAGVGTPEYDDRLRRAFAGAEAVLVLNPLVEAMLSPYARNVRVVTWGMDPKRFPWPWPDESPPPGSRPITRLIMAGLLDEFIKGYHILQDACEKLWQKRHDFELVATGEPAGRVNEFARHIGWLSQDELPRQIRAADILVMPTIAQEGLGRTTVEAMGVGRPVIASRIGGLPYTVSDGLTGLLFEPGNADDLASKIEVLLDNPDMRQRMGLSGRMRFEEEFSWERVIERQYRPLLQRRERAAAR